ncbi:pantetheinase [Plakobranchus ocellatus]|uniref:Pantetheinase n=1 Tax=Plakobranchus ocellatus TaxID=259542 RepID=A0AAV4CP01_9GAST|nr:pantetheinase [Plakobranchus ocellatus]
MAKETPLSSRAFSKLRLILFTAEILTAVCTVATQFQVITGSIDVDESAHVRAKFRAAVYAHAAFIPRDETPVSRSQALENMEINLKVFREQAAQAHKQNVQILVFPEDGIYGMRFNRETIYPYLEYMPDPSIETWIPCKDPKRYNGTEVQRSLSCMALENGLYIVANIGDKQPCDPHTDPKCPGDGRYQYNTNVAYGPDGTFLAKYHKYNLFFEDQFDTPEASYVYFDTPFGRFGLITCFDVLFKEPAIPLVEDYNVTNIVFPTAWMDALPLLPGIGFHSSFARTHHVNFLSANIHLPSFRFDGTGLYAPDGAIGFHYGRGDEGLSPELVVGEMEVLGEAETRAAVASLHAVAARSDLSEIRIDDYSAPFQSGLFGDMYTFRTLDEPASKIGTCQGRLCCELEYAIQADTFSDNELFAIGAFDGLHVLEGTYYMQNCALVKCAEAMNKSSCGSLVFNSSTVFTKIALRGQFQTPYVYPQVILSDSEGHLQISKPGAWHFTGSTIETSHSFNGTVLNAILLGRDYTRDDASVDGNSGSHLMVSFLVVISGLLGMKLLK